MIFLMQGQVGVISEDDIFWEHINFSLAESRTEPLASEMRKAGRQSFQSMFTETRLAGKVKK